MFRKNKSTNNVQDLIDTLSFPPVFTELKVAPETAAIEKIDNLSKLLSREIENFEYHSTTSVNGKSIEVNISVVSSSKAQNGESQSNSPSGQGGSDGEQ